MIQITKIEEQFCTEHGWHKVVGFKIDLEQMRDLPDDWDYYYFAKDDMDDTLELCEFWQNDDDNENVFEDTDQLIEYIEEHSEVSFDEWESKRKK